VTTYEVLMSEEFLGQCRADGKMLPAGFRLGEVTAHPAHQQPAFRACYVRVEDDEAPAELEGQLIDPAFRREYDDEWQWVRTVVVDRPIADRAAAGYVPIELTDDPEWVKCPTCQGERGWMNHDTGKFDECPECQGEGAFRA
jgi:hypothetical protein